jgi:peptidoglycan hydrolase-like protein with peptidoglycan-binding domain
VLSNGSKAGDDDPVTGALKRGDSGPEVKAMQALLLKWDPECLPEYGADGDFGRDTEDAVKAFQSDYRLPEDGVYGNNTHAALMTAIDNAGQPEPPAPDPLPEGTLKVKAGSWNIRTGPGTQYPTAGTVHGGDVLTEAETDGWIAIEHNDRLLWISSKALEG